MPMPASKVVITSTSGEIRNWATTSARQDQPALPGRARLRRQHLVERGQDQRRQDEDGHRDMAEDERRHDGGRVAEDEGGGHGRRLPDHKTAQGKPAAPRARGPGRASAPRSWIPPDPRAR